MNRVHRALWTCFGALLSVLAWAGPVGDVAGTVRDVRTGRSLEGVAVQLLRQEARTDANGRFQFQSVPVGVFWIEARANGYRPLSTRVLISAGRPAEIQLFLEPEQETTQLEAVEVTAPSSVGPRRLPLSHRFRDRIALQNEIGAGWDLQRALTSTPGVTTTSDRTNLLVVRGGSPAENQLLIDHIEVPTISHLSWQGEPGGAISFLNLDFLRGVDFYTGGFPARFGGKLSSVLDVRFREGNRERTAGELEASMAGFGGGIEGPLNGGAGSWIVSYRKGFLQPLQEKLQFDKGLEAIRFQDAHAKVVYDLSPTQRLSATALGSSDGVRIRWVRGAERAEFQSRKFADGLQWTTALGQEGNARWILSHTQNDYDVRVWQRRKEPAYINRSLEQETTLEGVLDWGDQGDRTWWLGFLVRRTAFHHRIDSRGWQGFSENQGRLVWLPEQQVDARHVGVRLAAFLHRDQPLGARMILRAGLRARYWTVTQTGSLEPRILWEWQPARSTRLSAAFGLYHQSPTYLELTLHPDNLALDDAQATHWIVGLQQRVGSHARVQIELYAKRYTRLPAFLEADQVAPSGRLINTGEKRVRGIDLLIEYRIPRGVQIAGTLSLSRAEARDHLSDWYPDDFDYRRLAAIAFRTPTVGGIYLGAKWRYVGGRPFTLFPVRKRPDGTYEPVPVPEERNRLRYPPYHRLDVRLDRRFDFGGWGLSLFLEVQNLYNRANVFTRQFIPRTGEFLDLKEFPRMALVGLIGDF